MILKPLVGVKRRSSRRTRLTRPPCREPGPHDMRLIAACASTLAYEQPQQLSIAGGGSAAPAPARFRQSFSRARVDYQRP